MIVRDNLHLTYCTNVHSGEDWPSVWDNLNKFVLEVKKGVADESPFGIGLRLSKQAADELNTNDNIAKFKLWLKQHNCYVFTINGFPYGAFQGESVKERVYLPDWTTRARVKYTLDLAQILASIMDKDLVSYGSISTVPVGYKDTISSTKSIHQAVNHLIEVAIGLKKISDNSSRHIVLAVEPEPSCYLETTHDAISFFEEYIFSDSVYKYVFDQYKIPLNFVETILRRHLGLCLDLCHAAVEFENPDEVIAEISRTEIFLAKIQISNSLVIDDVNSCSVKKLVDFEDGVYLHQVVESRGGELTHFSDVDAAIQHYQAREITEKYLSELEWRIHFHVPIFLNSLADYSSSQVFIEKILSNQMTLKLTQHFEIETYTWNVIPDKYKKMDTVQSIVCEMNWAKGRL